MQSWDISTSEWTIRGSQPRTVSWVTLAVPPGLNLERVVLTQTLKAVQKNVFFRNQCFALLGEAAEETGCLPLRAVIGVSYTQRQLFQDGVELGRGREVDRLAQNLGGQSCSTKSNVAGMPK
jgi:hypothetical protein